MREIKFRIYNPASCSILFDIENVYECLMQQHAYDKTQPTRGLTPSYDHKADGMVWMQYTGLKDRNGVEVYEGDIVSDGSIVDDYGTSHRAEIVFNKGAFRYGKSNCFCGDCESVALEGECDNLLVIGNIYQHPELLTT